MRPICLALILLVLASPLLAQASAPLTQSSAPVSVGLRLAGNTYQAQLELTQTATVKLWCPVTPGLISLTGLQQKTDVSYNKQAQTLEV
ncbi:MAG: hypothetical protein ABFE07_05635, partial [Armatimonadia bacterium]